MKEEGTTPTSRQWIYCVQPQALPGIPDAMAKKAVQGLGQLRSRVWLWLIDSKALIALDRAAGGESLVTKAEFRSCPMCARPLVGVDAERRRLMDESGPDGRLQPCSPKCPQDAKTRIWLRMKRATLEGNG